MKKVKWEYPNCNLCGKSKYKIVWDKVTTWEHKGAFRIVKCRSCGLVYLYPRPKREFITNFYPRETYWRFEQESNWRKWRDITYKPLYKFIFKNKKTGKVLDIGAGTGLFLTRLMKESWIVEGVELFKTASLFARKHYGISLKTGDFLDFSFPKKYFDVVTLSNSLEHLYKPSLTLKKINKVLKDNGILIIVVPNINSFGAKIFGKNWHPLQPPKHIYHFSPSTLCKILVRTNFQVEKISHSYWIHNYYSLFESFRFFFSPRFKKLPAGGLAKRTREGLPEKSSSSLVKEIGKVVAHMFAMTLSFLETIVGHGEVITIYAKKA